MTEPNRPVAHIGSMKILMLLFAFACLGATGPQAVPSQTVHIKDFAFKPAIVTIHVGDTVRFVNDDDEAHTATANDGSFDSKGLDTHDRWQFTFTKAGTFAYICSLHPYMKGKIVVEAAKR